MTLLDTSFCSIHHERMLYVERRGDPLKVFDSGPANEIYVTEATLLTDTVKGQYYMCIMTHWTEHGH